MKDNISLIAAAAGGFMLSLAAASIIKAAPITALQVQPRLSSNPAADLQIKTVSLNELVSYTEAATETLKKQEEQIKQLDFEIAPDLEQNWQIEPSHTKSKSSSESKVLGEIFFSWN